MKKALLLLALVGTIAVGADTRNKGEEYSFIKESNGTTSCTNYLGWARTTENTTATPSTNDAVWRIVREVLDADGVVVESKNAYGSGTGNNALWSTSWTNRASATYK